MKDILTELEKQVGPLEEQSEKAREYLHLKEDLKNYEIGLFLQDYDSFHEELEEVSGNITNTERELEEEKARQASTKTEFEQVELKIQAFDEQLERKKEKCNKDRLLCTEIEGEIKVAREKLSSLSDGKEYQAERMASIQAGIEQAEQEKQGYLETQKELLARLAEKQEQESALLAEESRLTAELTATSEAITDQNAIIDSTAGTSSEINLEKQKTESMMEQNSIRRAELNRQILSNKSQMAAAAEDMEREEKALDDIRETLDLSLIHI